MHNKLNYKWMFAKWHRLLGFGFGSGLIKPAPGTWGTLAGWLVWVLLLAKLPSTAAIFFLITAFVLGCFVCHKTGTDLGVIDHGAIVWDEMVAIWLVLFLVPADFITQLVAVLLFRLFDILKPQPIKCFEMRFANGFGVMLDDLLAAVYALLIMMFVLGFGWLPV